MLIGVPGSGKSTWITKQGFEDVIIASSDAYIETVAAKAGKTYDQMFSQAIGYAQKFCDSQVQMAINLDKTLVWDQTNTVAKHRKLRLARLPKEWIKDGVFFPTPDEAELQRRLDSRWGKKIPQNVIDSMIQHLEIPQLSEGFDEIIMLDKP
jgi:predicted kinase